MLPLQVFGIYVSGFVALTGSLLGTEGVITLCGILRRNYLPNLKTLNINRKYLCCSTIECSNNDLLAGYCAYE